MLISVRCLHRAARTRTRVMRSNVVVAAVRLAHRVARYVTVMGRRETRVRVITRASLLVVGYEQNDEGPVNCEVVITMGRARVDL